METPRRKRGKLIGLAVLLFAGLAMSGVYWQNYEKKLALVDEGMSKNPKGVLPHALDSCARQREFATRLARLQEPARAIRALDYCLVLLRLTEKEFHGKEVTAADIAEIQARAARELEQALGLTPDLANGLDVYRGCARCHTPEGWGLPQRGVPQIAGQHRTVVIKQLADIRAGHREAPAMLPYATVDVIGGVQSVADVAGYIDTLEISTDVAKGKGDQLELGEAVYEENCARCHGAEGQGDAEAFVPRIQSQHYDYLLAQMVQILEGRRRNANPEMQAQLEGLSAVELRAVLDYASRLEPPPELQAPPGWSNPDFAETRRPGGQ